MRGYGKDAILSYYKGCVGMARCHTLLRMSKIQSVRIMWKTLWVLYYIIPFCIKIRCTPYYPIKDAMLPQFSIIT